VTTNAGKLDLQELAAEIRVLALSMVAAAKASHIGGAFSLADVVAVLYGRIARVTSQNPAWADRDRIVLSKGHCCTAIYAALALRGFISRDELATYGRDGSRLMAHISYQVPGVEFSSGSLGHGLPFGVGRALAAKRRGSAYRTFVLLSDGELNEGSNWEAFLFAPQHRLDNLIAIIDYNKIQSLGSVADVMELHPLADKLKAFRWAVREVDGHDVNALEEALSTVPWEPDKPSCLIAHTTKGKGVDFMEGTLAWHYKSPSETELAAGLKQLGGN
jgi:transketolase